MDIHQASLQPHLLLFSFLLRFNPTPTILRVTFDRILFFLRMYLRTRPKSFLVSRPYAVSLLFGAIHGVPLRSPSFFCTKLSFGQFSHAFPGLFPFLSVINVAKIKSLHRENSGAITGCLASSIIPLFLLVASLPRLRVTPTHFSRFSCERAICLPTFFPILGLARLGIKQRASRTSWKAFASIYQRCFHLLLPARFSLLALPLLPKTRFSSVWS